MTESGPQAALARSTRLVDALRQPGPWPHPVHEPIGLVETHISWVLLTGPYAYKLHKPVNLGFLDFTGLEQRLHDCREELRLNRRLSQDLYLGLVAVVDSPAGLRVVEASEEPGRAPLPGGVLPLEVGLRMRQFPQEALLPAALAHGAIDGSQLDALALDLARFHQRAAVAPADGVYGTPAAVLQPVRDNITALEPRLPAHAQPLLEQVRHWSERCFADIRPLLEQRLAAGRVRECHGDLHLGNMLLLDGRIQVFDCLEFSPSLRWIDVISDMAFLVMDLEERGAPVLANRLLNAWLGETGDYDGLRLWNLQEQPWIVPLVWSGTAISFLFLYPATYNRLEIPAVQRPQVRLYGEGIMRISRHPQAVGQVLWCATHLLWIGTSFMVVTCLGLIAHHAFAIWHGDRRLHKRFGAAFEELRATTSILPFQAVLEGRQQLQLSEFLRPSQLGIAVAIGVLWGAHRWIGTASTAFSRTAMAHWLG